MLLTLVLAVSVNHAKVDPISMATQRNRDMTLENSACLVVILLFM